MNTLYKMYKENNTCIYKKINDLYIKLSNMVYLYIKHNFAESNIFSTVFQIALKCSCEISLHVYASKCEVKPL